VFIEIIPNFISGLDSFGIVKREKRPANIIKNIVKKETLYFLTQKPKNHFSRFLFIFSVSLFVFIGFL
jgi:hypothetical protein